MRIDRNYIRRGWAVLAALFLCAAAPPPAKPKLVIAALGDSTTLGTPFEKDPEAPYTEWMKKRHPDWEVLNYGVKGDTTDQIRARLEQVLNNSPRFIIILGGVNDVYQDLPLDQTTKNLLYMYQRSKAKFVIPVAATVLPFDAGTKAQNAKLKKLNAWIEKTSDDQRIPFVDLHAAVANPEDPTKLNGSPDGLHPDIGGYRSMAMAIIPVIEKLAAALPK